MKEGKRKYVSELAKQLAQLREWLSSEAKPDDRQETAKSIYRVAHTLKGSAPMFGFVRVGAAAQKLVEVWEWTQSEENKGQASEAIGSYSHCVEKSAPILLELELELDIYGRELELDEQQERMHRSLMQPGGERLLVIDDDEVLRSYLVRRLRLDGYEVDEAADVATAEKLLREKSYQLVTLDLMMHPVSGYELFECLKEDPTLKWLPLIVLSGREDVNDKVRCFYLGADDYVTKPFQYEELAARIYSLLKRTKTFEQMAFRDPLTGVYNRRFFDHQIQVELQRIGRYPGPISLAFIDIDRFKSINDTYGHHVGDLVLQGLAHLLQDNLRSTDVLARFGGEEFVIVFPNTSGPDAKKTIEHILKLAQVEPVAQNEGQAYRITFSAGISEWVSGMDVQSWIEISDSAMYAAKEGGRNRVVLRMDGEAAANATQLAQTSVRKRVLIADDDKILRSILIAKLKHLPVDFQEAVDGEEAYQIMMEQPVHLCILDGVMPRLDGYALLKRLQEKDERPYGMKIMILSGRGREEDVSRGLQYGADGYMHKPFSMVELELRVKELLELP
ncbi:GGDEF domain-containing response regulator [Paenibacillus puerhi]|uniref:GGDEF domain-containing response regulator n=1 Tax=Paenibacillus puerhi TaxID=2692622 RepID=UPI001357C5AD|nr:response regulator [Paenibacillus puerhi]